MQHPNIRLLLQYLRDCHQKGDSALFSEMSEIIHDDIKRRRYHLIRALQIARDEYQMVFVSLHGEGYRPLKNGEIADKCSDRKKKIKRESERWRSDLDCVDLTTLSQTEMVKYAYSGMQLYMVESVVSEESQKAIESKVRTYSDPMECFKGIDIMELLGGVS